MFLSDDSLICSASDLAGFLACERLTALGLRAPRGEVERPEKARSLTAAHGDRHERRYLDAMKGPGRPPDPRERAVGRTNFSVGNDIARQSLVSHNPSCPPNCLRRTDLGRDGPEARRTNRTQQSARSPGWAAATSAARAPHGAVAAGLRGLRDAPGLIGSTDRRQSRVRGQLPRMSAIRRTEPQSSDAATQ